MVKMQLNVMIGMHNQILKWSSKGLNEFTFLRMTEKLMDDKKTWNNFVNFTMKMHNLSHNNHESDQKQNNKKNDKNKTNINQNEKDNNSCNKCKYNFI